MQKTSKKIVFTFICIEINKNNVFYWKIIAKKQALLENRLYLIIKTPF